MEFHDSRQTDRKREGRLGEEDVKREKETGEKPLTYKLRVVAVLR